MDSYFSSVNDPLETAAWYWLVHESGLGLRRCKTILTDQVASRGQKLHEILVMGSSYWDVLLSLSPEEILQLEKQYTGLEDVSNELEAWHRDGLNLLRWNELSYPPTLRAHLRPEQQPLLLSYQGEPGLLELPAVMACAGNKVEDEAITWTFDTLFELAGEGAIPLAVARPGFDANIVKVLLQAEAPLLLVLPQGLAQYQPPGTLMAAVEGGRALLLSPFNPQYEPPQKESNPMLPHAAGFAQALANALILISPPYPDNLLPEQPCFLRPDIPKTVGCQRYYTEPEALFLELVETPVAAAVANAYTSPVPAVESKAPEPGVDPEALIDQLTALGNVPESMKARIRAANRPTNH